MLLSNSFDPDIRVYKEAFELVKQGFDVTIHCWDRTCSKAQYEILDGIKIVRYQIKSIPGSGLKQLPAYYKFYKILKKSLKKENGCILHCHDFDTMIIGTRFKNMFRVFDIHENYNYNLKGLKGFIYNKLFKKCVKLSSAIVYVSQQQRDKIPLSLNDKKCILLPNYPRLQDYVPIEKTPSSQLRINYIGVVRDKGSLQTLIRSSGMNNLIGIYGDGIASESLREYNKDYCAQLFGKFDGIQESARIYRDTDILYCVYDPQNYNWKNAYFVKFYEAILTKTPIIVARNTLVGEYVVKHNIGAVVTYGDDQSLQDAITYIHSNYQAILSNITEIAHLFLWEDVVSDLVCLYKEA